MSVSVTDGERHSVNFIKNGKEAGLIENSSIHDGDVRLDATVEAGDKGAWYLVELRDENGRLAVLTNPIYIDM
jgi:hypothetical protein